MRYKIAALSLVFAISGCEKVSEITGANRSHPGFSNLSIEINLSSPDNAIKTWWRSPDAVSKMSNQQCYGYIRARAESKHYSKISTGEVLDYMDSLEGACAETLIEREIVEIKQETDTRAVAIASIRNVTPSNKTPTDDQKEKRAKGEIYKYLVEKVGNEWKVSQVFVTKESFMRDYPGDLWEKQYKRYESGYPYKIYDYQ